jgi:hypothetical protein
VVSHCTAASASPSNNSTALSKIFEMRNNRSDSSGANRPALRRRARVRSGIPISVARASRSRPLLDSSARNASNDNPTSSCSINCGIVVARSPRLDPRVLKWRVRLTGFVPDEGSPRFVLVRVAIELGYSLFCHSVMEMPPPWHDSGIRTHAGLSQYGTSARVISPWPYWA